MKVVLKYLGEEILSYDTKFDPGFGHLNVVMMCLLDTVAHEKPEIINIEIGFITFKKEEKCVGKK